MGKVLQKKMKQDGDEECWLEEIDASVTICDLEGIIVYMNKKSIEQFKSYGGESLIGTHLLECHPEPSKTLLTKMLANPENNMYTTEKGEIRQMIYQTPWKKDDKISGIVELSFRLDKEIPHHIRK